MDFENRAAYSGVIYMHTFNEHPDQAHFERHCHEYYELLYVVSGEGRYVVESTEYPLQPNMLLLIRPYEFHYVCPKKNTPYERYVLHFKGSVLGDVVNSLPIMCTDGHREHGVYFPPYSFDGSVRQVIANLEGVRELFKGTPNHRAKRSALVHADLTRSLLLLSLSEPERVSVEDGNVIPRVIDHLNLNLDKEVSLDELSQQFFISKYYLCHAFRKYTGVTLFQYLSVKRIAMAQHLLELGEPATSVAYAVGFRNYSSFYRTFCKVTGHAPVYGRQEKGEESGTVL